MGQGPGISIYLIQDSVASKDEVAMQVQLFPMVLKMVGEPVIKGSVAFLEDASTNKVEVDDAAFQTAEATAGNYIDKIMVFV